MLSSNVHTCTHAGQARKREQNRWAGGQVPMS